MQKLAVQSLPKLQDLKAESEIDQVIDIIVRIDALSPDAIKQIQMRCEIVLRMKLRANA